MSMSSSGSFAHILPEPAFGDVAQHSKAQGSASDFISTFARNHPKIMLTFLSNKLRHFV